MFPSWPLMRNNITREDREALIAFLESDPILTQSTNVAAFEREWSEWLGTRYSVFVNSGSSANILSMAALKILNGTGEAIVSPFGWISDLVAVLINGFGPVFTDIHPKTLSMNNEQILAKCSKKTKAVLLVHAQGFNGLSDQLLRGLGERKIPLIEDVCESHGATHHGRKLGSFGLISNFSFYFAHHLSTIEGGMVCTDDEEVYQIVRMLRSHGMVRESTNQKLKDSYREGHPDLHPDFIFAYPGFNMRNTEIGAVLGRNQLKRLDSNNEKRRRNFKLFLDNLDSKKFRTDFELDGSCNYAFNLILNKPDQDFCNRLMETMRTHRIEFRRGSAGGGNQLRQPYVRKILNIADFSEYAELEHVHFFGFYIGNYPDLEFEEILQLCSVLNSVK